jgi:hypothetical protein
MLTCHCKRRHAREKRVRNDPIVQLIITARDQVLGRYGNALAALGEGRSPARCAAINREGDEDKDSRSGPNDKCFASSV